MSEDLLPRFVVTLTTFQSFVKLNNIEYAMQAMDKLEKLINVDTCAEIQIGRAHV